MLLVLVLVVDVAIVNLFIVEYGEQKECSY